MGMRRLVYSEEEEEEVQEEVKQETREQQESSEEENEGASTSSPASEDESEQSIALPSCSREETHAMKPQESMDEHTLSWVPSALANIKSVDSHMLSRDAFIAHTSPITCLPDLERVRRAAMALMNNTDAAISFAKAQQNLLDKKVLEGKVSALQQELAQSVQHSRTKHHKQHALLRQARANLLKQHNLFKKEKESLIYSHKLERKALIDEYTHEQRDLKRQLEEEKDKSLCCVCRDKLRDTIILPCLHFQYCFSCVLLHREANSNTCPTCRGPIQGLSMSSYLATL